MIASLPMYDWPEMNSVNDAFWHLLRDNFEAKGIKAPHELMRAEDETYHWLLPDLLIGQTCGYPFATQLKDKVRYLATPQYDVKGCQNAHYSSALITHIDAELEVSELRGTRLAYNSVMSWSGYRAIILEFGWLDEYFGSLLESGGHRQSARMVAGKTADVAALDAVCWHLLQRHEPQTAAKLKVVFWSRFQPALPFITSIHTPHRTIESLREGLKEVLATVENREICDQISLKGCEILDPGRYSPLAEV